MANFVPPIDSDHTCTSTGAAIEYAVNALKIGTIVIMGHAGCGGIAAYLAETEPVDDDRFIGRWVTGLACVGMPDAKADASCHTTFEKAAVLQSMQNLQRYDFVAKAVYSGQTEIIGAYFQIDKALLFLTDDNGGFAIVNDC